MPNSLKKTVIRVGGRDQASLKKYKKKKKKKDKRSSACPTGCKAGLGYLSVFMWSGGIWLEVKSLFNYKWWLWEKRG